MLIVGFEVEVIGSAFGDRVGRAHCWVVVLADATNSASRVTASLSCRTEEARAEEWGDGVAASVVTVDAIPESAG